MKNYVIIGGGVASVGCIEGIKSVDKNCKITLISEEGNPVYCRPLISYYLQGKTDFEKMKYRPDGFYKENGCETVYGKAEKIDPEKKSVFIGGKNIGYDALCVATGSSPFVPPFKGLEKVKNKTSFMTENDAVKLEKMISATADVLVVGAGLIGLKCAEGLAEKVNSVTVCDLSSRVLSSILDEECAALIQKRLEEHGFNFMLKDSVAEFTENSALMASGKRVNFDVLVLAVGVRANLSLIKDAGGKTERGVITDLKMKTSIKDVYAAGDCAQGYDSSINSCRVLAIWPNAYMQGYTAGVNMAGGNEEFSVGIPMNAISFFGMHALTAGAYTGEVFEEKGENFIKRLFIEDGKLAGFILIGSEKGAGIYTSLIRNRVPLSSVNINLLKKSPELAIFDGEIRAKMLGGVV